MRKKKPEELGELELLDLPDIEKTPEFLEKEEELEEKKAQELMAQRQEAKWPQIVSVLLGLLLFLTIAAALFYHYTADQLHAESVAQLDELGNQLLEKLDVQLSYQWGYLDKLQELVTDTDSMTREEMTEFLAHAESDFATENRALYFRAIEETGYYYTSAGRQGMWTCIDNLGDSARQSFLLTNWADETVYMAFTHKLETPLKAGGKTITHFILLRKMEDLASFFQCTAFNGGNNVYVIDPTGVVLFEQSVLPNVKTEGRNIFHNLEEMEYPHYGSIESIIEAGQDGKTICTDVKVGGENCYILYNVLPSYEWGIIVMVSADDVAVSAREMVKSLLILFCAMGVIVALSVSFFMLFVWRVRGDQKLLKVREESEKRLTQANYQLENANIELEEAQEETKKALEVAQKATRAKSQFLANMSHDIRTPMNAICGMARLMEHDVEDVDKQRYYIRKLQTSSQYLLGLINDILDMSKIESSEVKLSFEPVKMAEQVGQIESIIRSQSNERGQTFIIISHDLKHEYLVGDSVRLRQIFLNLLTNAVKYTQNGGDIRFELTELKSEDGYATIRISVIDNGYGMSEEFQKTLFKPFTRAQNSVTNKEQGTGLGMAITKSLVDLMGGTITVQSKEGEGTRFDVTLTLPIDTSSDHVTPVKNVLLIANEEALIRNVTCALTDEPVRLRTVHTPEEAAAEIHADMPEVILLSGYLHDMRLAETVRKLRTEAKDAMLIFCCDYARREHITDALKGSGVDGVIARPFFVENLILAVENARQHAKPVTRHEEFSPLRGKKFLCAEDNELNAEILNALLNMHGAECDIYPDGAELVKAFATVKEGDYTAILMDMQMPNMNGVDATRIIRSGNNPLGKTIPIIAMTANAFSSDVQECLNAGMNAHLAKPVDLSALERLILEIDQKNSGGGTRVRENE